MSDSGELFYNSTCFYQRSNECSLLSGGGTLLIGIILTICITSCLCLRKRKRRRRRSSDISESTAGKPAQNDYKIENLTNDDTESYSNGSGATGSGQGNYHMKDLSVRTPKSFGSSETKDSSDQTKSNPLDSIPENEAETKYRNSASRGHRYDDVLPSDVSNSIDAPSKTKLEPYSEAKTHTLVLSNTDSRGSSKPGHTYHLLDGSRADEKATFVEATATYSNTTGKDTSFLRGNLASGNVMLGQMSENGQSRRTTLSGIPSKSGVFDDPTYANTATTFTATGKPPLNKFSQNNDNGPQRSSSLTQNTGKQSKNSTAQALTKTKNEASEKPVTIVFDDPTYDVGLNLANT